MLVLHRLMWPICYGFCWAGFPFFPLFRCIFLGESQKKNQRSVQLRDQGTRVKAVARNKWAAPGKFRQIKMAASHLFQSDAPKQQSLCKHCLSVKCQREPPFAHRCGTNSKLRAVHVGTNNLNSPFMLLGVSMQKSKRQAKLPFCCF